jgi:uncharacterized protein YdaU (DUF1376 family)
MKKSPAFQFYVQDFLVGTMFFTAAEIGAYILLLCHQWDNGFIPEDEIEFVTRTDKASLVRVLKKFVTTPEGLQNTRLETVRKEQQEYRKKQSEKGRAGAAKRWDDSTGIKNDGTGIKNDGTGHSSAIVLPLPKNGSSSSSSPSNIAKLDRDKIFEIMRMKTDRNRITDRQLYDEVAAFINKYNGQDIKKLDALISTWAANVQPVRHGGMVI